MVLLCAGGMIVIAFYLTSLKALVDRRWIEQT
jgi:hypothetical protein